MKKIISLFVRDYEGNRLVRDEVVPGAEWVQAGEGIATRKYDGTCCMVKGGELYARYDAKNGKTPPVGFIPAQDPDLITGHWPGWVKCDHNDPQWKWHFDGFDNMPLAAQIDGTYELCGPKFRTNPEHFSTHVLVPHGNDQYMECPRTFDEIREWFKGKDIEGVVWHHPDGRMVKIKKKDFGMKRTD